MTYKSWNPSCEDCKFFEKFTNGFIANKQLRYCLHPQAGDEEFWWKSRMSGHCGPWGKNFVRRKTFWGFFKWIIKGDDYE